MKNAWVAASTESLFCLFFLKVPHSGPQSWKHSEHIPCSKSLGSLWVFLPAEVAGGDKLRLSVTARVFLNCLHFCSLFSFSSQSPPLAPPAPPLLRGKVGGITAILCHKNIQGPWFPKLLGHLFKATSWPHVKSIISPFINSFTWEQMLCPSP